jgi:hypothetical protein
MLIIRERRILAAERGLEHAEIREMLRTGHVMQTPARLSFRQGQLARFDP